MTIDHAEAMVRHHEEWEAADLAAEWRERVDILKGS